MEKRKMMGIGLSALLFLGLAGTAIGYPAERIAFADETDGTEITQPVSPEEGTNGKINTAVSLTVENADFFLPNTYEQYLSLKDPTDVAVSGEYIAVAQGSKIFVCNRTGENISYRCYEHKNGLDVSKIQFSGKDKLYFSDQSANFYVLDLVDLTYTEEKDVNASTFCIVGDILFTAVVTSGTTYYQYSLDNLSDCPPFDKVDGSIKTPQLTYLDGKLYSVVDRQIIVYEYSETKKSYTYSNFLSLGDNIAGLKSAYALSNGLYYTIGNNIQTESLPNGLYCFDLNKTSTFLKAGNDYGALTAFDGNLYAIEGNSVLEYSVTGESASLTGYEISSSSDSINRLMSAVDAVRAGNLLLVADEGAKRVSVYDQTTHSYSVIDCGFAPSFVATDGETIAVASKNEIFACTAKNRELVSLRKMESNVNVQGLACVFGNVYYITNNNGYGLNDEAPVIHNYDTPSRRLTSDLYGTLYVSYADGSVRSFTEEAFVSEQGGVKCGSVPQNHSSLRADFEGNLYCLSENKIYKNGEKFAVIDGYDFVYHYDAHDEVDAPVSFALGFEDSEVYFFFKNHAVKSKQGVLDIPTLDRIQTGDIAEKVFSVHENNLFLDVSEKTVGISISLAELDGAEYFPYENYFRLTEDSRGILLGATERYYLVLLPAGIHYTAALFRMNLDYIADDGYWTDADEAEASKRYFLSSNVSSYYAPCLEPALAELSLSRGTVVSLIGYVEAPDLEYALIRYAYENGDAAQTRVMKKGYVPKSFLTNVSPLPEESTQYLSVYLKENEEGLLLTSEDGGQLLVKDRTEAKAWENEDGSYTVCVEQNGKCYYGTADESQIDWKTANEALRIALIVVLSVLALVIIGAYVFLLPRKKATEKKEKNKKKRVK